MINSTRSELIPVISFYSFVKLPLVYASNCSQFVRELIYNSFEKLPSINSLNCLQFILEISPHSFAKFLSVHSRNLPPFIRGIGLNSFDELPKFIHKITLNSSCHQFISEIAFNWFEKLPSIRICNHMGWNTIND